MNRNNDINSNIKSLADLKSIDYYYLVGKFELISQNDIEKIMDHFSQYFDFSKRTQILALPAFSSSQIVMELLRQYCVPIHEFYDCIYECGLHDICDWFNQNYPNEVINPTRAIDFSFVDTNKNLINLNTSNTIIKNFQTPSLPPLSAWPSDTLLLYEQILPVVYEKKQTSENQISSNLSSPKRLNDTNKLFGYFQMCYIDERKLTYRKREFNDPISYIKELKMIKNRHLNLYTAECILKGTTSRNYYLLYSYDTVNTQLLRDYAEIHRQVSPTQYNSLQQLEILRDISCGLSFLHEKNESKKYPILHSNLNPDSILIEIRGDNQVSAKIFDFVHSVEMNENENYETKLRDEFYKFGQIIFFVATWRYLDKSECDQLHFEQKGEEDNYLFELFKRFDIVKQPDKYKIQILLKMFYKLTSSNYDITKGIEKSYAHIKQLIQKKPIWS